MLTQYAIRLHIFYQLTNSNRHTRTRTRISVCMNLLDLDPSWRLWLKSSLLWWPTARGILLPFSSLLRQTQQDLSNRETLAVLNWLFSTVIFIRLLSSAASHPRIYCTGFLISIITLNLRFFSTAHHHCRITITQPTHQHRWLGKYRFSLTSF